MTSPGFQFPSTPTTLRWILNENPAHTPSQPRTLRSIQTAGPTPKQFVTDFDQSDTSFVVFPASWSDQSTRQK